METVLGPPSIATGPELLPKRPMLRPGERVLHDRFSIIAPLVAEAPGAYFAAHDHLTQSEAVLRVLLLHTPISVGSLARLRHDIRYAAASPHPYLIRVLESAATDEMLLLATEPRGVSLRRVLAQQRIELRTALTFAVQIAGGLGFAHLHGAAHGRLTPASIAIVAETARLADLGLGQVAAAFADPWPGDLAARPGYLAPEAAHAAFPTPALDIYHFGALLWEMVCGAAPDVNAATQPAPTEIDLPPALVALMRQCLHPRPDQRPPGMPEIALALKTIKRGMEGKRPGDTLARLQERYATAAESTPPISAEVATNRLPATNAPPPALVDGPTLHLTLPTAPQPTVPQAKAPQPTMPQPSAPPAPHVGLTATATLPVIPLPTRPSRWRRALPLKLALAALILVALIAIFAITSGRLLPFSYAAAP